MTVRQVLCSFVLPALVVLTMPGRRAAGADWPNYRGPDHNGISKETDWNSNWGAAGPKILWKKSLGTGFSTTAVAAGRVYNMGNSGKDTDTVYCLDAQTGQELWKYSYPCPRTEILQRHALDAHRRRREGLYPQQDGRPVLFRCPIRQGALAETAQ
jgi:hypothetical protein